MTTPTQGPLVSAVAFEPMTVGAIAEALVAHQFAIVALGPRVVHGARPVAGHPSTVTRVVAFARIAGSSAWTGALQLRHPHPQAGEPCHEPLVEADRYPAETSRLLHQVRWVRTLDELEAWLGGVCSIPIDDAERAAIAGAELPSLFVAWWTGTAFTEWHIERAAAGTTFCGRTPADSDRTTRRRDQPAAVCEVCAATLLRETGKATA